MIEIVLFSQIDQSKFENVAPATFYCWETDEIAVKQGKFAIVMEGDGCENDPCIHDTRLLNREYGAVKRADDSAVQDLAELLER